jgi:hypothetical protein
MNLEQIFKATEAYRAALVGSGATVKNVNEQVIFPVYNPDGALSQLLAVYLEPEVTTYVAPTGCDFVPAIPGKTAEPSGTCVCEEGYGHKATDFERYKQSSAPRIIL